jgi:hypothetical protein
MLQLANTEQVPYAPVAQPTDELFKADRRHFPDGQEHSDFPHPLRFGRECAHFAPTHTPMAPLLARPVLTNIQA